MAIFDPPYVLQQHREGPPLPEGTKEYKLSHRGVYHWIEDSAGSAIALVWSVLERDTIDNGLFLIQSANERKELLEIALELMRIATLYSEGKTTLANNQFKYLRAQRMSFFVKLGNIAVKQREEALRQKRGGA